MAELSRGELRASFDRVADLYDRTRVVCPPAVFDDVIALAGLEPDDEVLEIGCGTGQATAPLAARGLRVLAVELGANLAAAARAKFAGNPRVEIVWAAFEDWDAGNRAFDAVVCVNAFHWIDPEVAYAKVHSLLRPNGSLALVGTPIVTPPDADPFWYEVQEEHDRLELFDRIHRRIVARPDPRVSPTLLATVDVARRLELVPGGQAVTGVQEY